MKNESVEREISDYFLQQLRYFEHVLLFLHTPLPHVMIFNIRIAIISYTAWITFGFWLPEQSRIRTLSGPNRFG